MHSCREVCHSPRQVGHCAVGTPLSWLKAQTNPLLKNPERGMYYGRLPDSDDYHTIVPEWLYLNTVCAQNLTWNGYNQTGTSPVLNAYAAKLENYRTNGVKVL